MGKTTIGWTDVTLQLSRGCDPVSPGCANCWAAEIAARFSGPGLAFEGLAKFKTDGRRKLAVWTKAPVQLVPEAMLTALSWRKPKRVFVNSVSDLFHGDIPFEYIAAWWAVMAATPHITYQIVTKRAARMPVFFAWTKDNGGPDHWLRCALDLFLEQAAAHARAGRADETKQWAKAKVRLFEAFKAVTATAELVRKTTLLALPNVWLLTSTENQETFDERVPHLLSCPAVVHGVSAEPLLGPIDMGLDRWVRLPHAVHSDGFPGVPLPALTAEPGIYKAKSNRLGALSVRVRTGGHGELGIKPGEFERLHLRWVIVGGESGDNARPCAEAWVRDTAKQVAVAKSRGANVALFVKQLGSRPTGSPDCTGCEGEQFEGTACLRCGDTVELADGMRVLHLKHGKGEDPGEWSPDLRVQEFPVPA